MTSKLVSGLHALVFFSVCLLSSALCFARSTNLTIDTTYYVDATAGSDANSGTSPASAWRSVAKVNATRFGPGDRILFKRGDTWREVLAPDSSGETGNPIVIDAYVTGAAPILTGANLLPQSAWTRCSTCQNNVWHASVSTRPNVVMFNGAHGNQKTAISALATAGDWYWVADVVYVWCTLNPGSYYLSPGVEAGNRAVVVNLSALAYVTVQNLELRGANGLPTNGIVYAHMQNGIPPHDLILNNLQLSNGAGNGVHFEDCNNCMIGGTKISDMGSDGISLAALHTEFPVTRGSVVGNTVSNSGHDGIATYGCAIGGDCQGLTLPQGIFLSGMVISGNTVHDNGEGIYLEWTNHSTIASNSVYHNADTTNSAAEGGGIELEASSNN